MSERNLYEVTGDIKDINTLLVSREEWNRRAQPQQASDLVERCREILAWKETGLLAGNALRSFAKAKWGDDHMALSLAEADTMKEALEILVSQPAQAGQVLSDDEIEALYDAVKSKGWSLDFARAIEQAVLSKRVPMPPEDWSVFNGGAEVASGLTWAEAWDYMTPSRIERGWTAVCVANKSNIGIVGEKGGA